ncbi:MAG TPA: PEP/pyruvate-binding domain-containing protein [Propionibacteriaceae bacterium]
MEGRGANLSELTTAGLPVPPGFLVTAAAYLAAVSESGARARSPGCCAGSMSTTPHRLQRPSGAAHEEIKATPIPAEIADASRTRMAASGMMLPSRCGRREQRGSIGESTKGQSRRSLQPSRRTLGSVTQGLCPITVSALAGQYRHEGGVR